MAMRGSHENVCGLRETLTAAPCLPKYTSFVA